MDRYYPDAFNSVVYALKGEPEEVKAQWHYAMDRVMINEGLGRILETREIDGRTSHIVQTVTGEVMTVERPPIAENMEEQLVDFFTRMIHPSEIETTEIAILEEVRTSGQRWSPANLGDIIEANVQRIDQLQFGSSREYGYKIVGQLLDISARAEIGWSLFEIPPTVSDPLTDLDVVNLMSLLGMLTECMYGCRMIEQSATRGWGGSAATRFYMNSVYQYISSLFLLYEKEQLAEGFTMGGTAVLVLQPLGLDALLSPLKNIFGRPFGKNRAVGRSILHWRNKGVTHYDATRKHIEDLIEDTSMREMGQQLEWRRHLIDLMHQIALLRLRILAMTTKEKVDPLKSTLQFIATNK